MLLVDIPLFKRPLSRLGFGGASLSGEGGGYGFGAMDEASAEALIKSAWERGINLYDTAPIYGFGLSEERLGRYLPKEAFLITKSGVDWHPNMRVNMSNDPKVTEKMLLASLKRLKREQIDLYMVHWPDSNVDIRRPMEVLARYQEKGVLLHLGLCNSNPMDLKKAGEISKITALQSELNLFQTKAFDLFESDWKNFFSMAWGTFDKGILTGRVTKERKYDSTDARSWAPWWNKKEVVRKIEQVEKISELIKEEGVTLTQLALHFNLFYFGVNSTLIGFKSKKDLEEAYAAFSKPLALNKIQEIITKISPQTDS
jgi:aryl-alcohol dehydrogenase-like predicted oxidoreductase